MATQPLPEEPKKGQNKPQIVERPTTKDWAKPQAMAIPKDGYFRLEKGPTAVRALADGRLVTLNGKTLADKNDARKESLR